MGGPKSPCVFWHPGGLKSVESMGRQQRANRVARRGPRRPASSQHARCLAWFLAAVAPDKSKKLSSQVTAGRPTRSALPKREAGHVLTRTVGQRGGMSLRSRPPRRVPLHVRRCSCASPTKAQRPTNTWDQGGGEEPPAEDERRRSEPGLVGGVGESAAVERGGARRRRDVGSRHETTPRRGSSASDARPYLAGLSDLTYSSAGRADAV